MQVAVVRGLATVLTLLVLIGCGRQPEPFPTKTPEELKQLTDVTDAVVEMIRSSDRRQALPRAVAALSAASKQYEQHKSAISSVTNAATLGCIDSHAIEILDLETMLAKLDEAAQLQDQKKVERRLGLLWMLASKMGECAVTSSMLFVEDEKRPEALKHSAVVISEIYSSVLIFRAAADLKLEPLLEHQLRDYETIVTRLGPDHGVQLITDAVPKLKAALAHLNASAAVEPSP